MNRETVIDDLSSKEVEVLLARQVVREQQSTVRRTPETRGHRLGSLIKTAVRFLYLYSGYVQLRDLILSMAGRSRAVVLYYHRIGDSGVMTRPAEEFRKDLRYLKDRYDCISLSELCRRIQANAPLRRRSVVVTFDDGYRDNFLEAAPILKSLGLTATFFVATGFIGTDREFPHDERRRGRKDCSGSPLNEKLDWDDLRAMEREGFEVGSHTVNHTDLGAADDRTIEYEVNGSLAELNKQLGARPRAFSFPWGKPAEISERAISAIKQAGYYGAASAYGGSNSRGSDLFNIRRVDVGNGLLGRLELRARVVGLQPDFFRLKVKKWRI